MAQEFYPNSHPAVSFHLVYFSSDSERPFVRTVATVLSAIDMSLLNVQDIPIDYDWKNLHLMTHPTVHVTCEIPDQYVALGRSHRSIVVGLPLIQSSGNEQFDAATLSRDRRFEVTASLMPIFYICRLRQLGPTHPKCHT